MAEIGLNVFQVLQNELIAREGNRSTLGIGFRLSILEDKICNVEAMTRNGRVWKYNHALSPIKALTPEARRLAQRQKRRLLNQKGATKGKDDKDPTKLVRDEEVWEVHPDFPHTVLDFKELQFHLDKVRSLLEFYDVKVYRTDHHLVDMHPDDGHRDIKVNLDTCLEELAMCWGLDWFRIEGLTLPSSR